MTTPTISTETNHDPKLEHLLETRIDDTQIGPQLTSKAGQAPQDEQVFCLGQFQADNFLEVSSSQCLATGELPLHSKQPQPQQQQLSSSSKRRDEKYLVARKRRVVKFLRYWMLIARDHFFQQPKSEAFLKTMQAKVREDANQFESLKFEFEAIVRLFGVQLEEQLEVGQQRRVKRWICDPHGNILPIRLYSGSYWNQLANEQFLASIQQRRFELSPASFQSNDEIVFRVYCADHTFTTLRSRLDEKAAEIKLMAAKKLRLPEKELILVHVKSNGERIVFNDLDTNISTSLSVNGRLFVGLLDHIDAISPLPEQDPHQEMYRSASFAAGGASAPASAVAVPGQQEHACSASMPNGNIADPSATHGDLKANNNNPMTAQATGEQQPATLTAAAGAGTAAAGHPTSQDSQQTSNQHQLQTSPCNLVQIRAQMALSPAKLEEFSSRDVAYCLTQLAWSLLNNMHEYELIYNVFGRGQLFKEQMITANSNVFLRHFNEIQYWVVTEICLSSSLSKRVQMLRKFIKIAAHCKDLQNLNAAFAIIMGLSNMAVARLTQTWERLPGKLKRLFSQFESLIDPSRNHRRYRIFMSKLEPPIIPFMPLFLKDMTFAHEGNQTYLENGLINFEKMQMVAQTLRTLRYCKSRPMKLNPSVCKYKGSVRAIELFLRDLKIIDNQRTLTQLSHQLEHRKN